MDVSPSKSPTLSLADKLLQDQDPLVSTPDIDPTIRPVTGMAYPGLRAYQDSSSGSSSGSDSSSSSVSSPDSEDEIDWREKAATAAIRNVEFKKQIKVLEAQIEEVKENKKHELRSVRLELKKQKEKLSRIQLLYKNQRLVNQGLEQERDGLRTEQEEVKKACEARLQSKEKKLDRKIKDINELQQSCSRLTEQTLSDKQKITELEESLKKLESGKTTRESTLAELTEELEQHKKRIESLIEERTEVEKERESQTEPIKELVASSSGIIENNDELRKRICKFEAGEQKWTKASEAERHVKQLEEQIARYQSDSATIRKEAETHKKELEQRSQQLENLRTEYQSLQQKQKVLLQIVGVLETLVSQFEADICDLKTLHNEEIRGIRSHATNLERSLSELSCQAKLDLQIFKSNVTRLEGQLAEIRRPHNEAHLQWQMQNSALEDAREKHHQELKSLESSHNIAITTLRTKLNTATSSYETLKQDQRDSDQRYQEQLARASASLEQELAEALERDEEHIAERDAALEQLKSKTKELENIEAHLSETRQCNDSQRRNMEASNRKHQEEIDRIINEHEAELQKFDTWLTDAEKNAEDFARQLEIVRQQLQGAQEKIHALENQPVPASGETVDDNQPVVHTHSIYSPISSPDRYTPSVHDELSQTRMQDDRKIDETLPEDPGSTKEELAIILPPAGNQVIRTPPAFPEPVFPETAESSQDSPGNLRDYFTGERQRLADLTETEQSIKEVLEAHLRVLSDDEKPGPSHRPVAITAIRLSPALDALMNKHPEVPCWPELIRCSEAGSPLSWSKDILRYAAFRLGVMDASVLNKSAVFEVNPSFAPLSLCTGSFSCCPGIAKGSLQGFADAVKRPEDPFVC